MKLYIKILLIWSAFMLTLTPLHSERPKVGVVLMGGGAKGFAHIGALKVIEEAGIPIDYIAGTSMGAIVGGLYSIGYNSQALDSLARHQDWMHLLTDEVYRYNLSGTQKENAQTYIVSMNYEKQGIKLPSSIVSGQNIYNLMLDVTTGYHENVDFHRLPIPFSCVAADVKTGKEVVLSDGILPQALRASMAIPGFFSPVKIDSMLLIDGGILNNYPVDVVKKMGADIVIGVSFDKDEKKIEKNMGSFLELTHDFGNFLGNKKLEENLRNTDLSIRVKLDKYNIASFRSDEIDSIIRIGETTTRNMWNELIELKNKLGSDDEISIRQIKNPYIETDTLLIRSVFIEGLSAEDQQLVLNRLRIGPKTTRKDLQNMISRMYGTDLFSKVFYRLENQKPPYDVVLEIEKKDIRNLNVGVRFDTQGLASILLNSSIRVRTSLNSTFGVTARLNKNPYLQIDYSLSSTMLYKGGVRFKTSKNDINIFEKGRLAYNVGFYQNTLNVNFSEFHFYNMNLQLGMDIDYFYYLYELKNSGLPTLNLESKPYMNYVLNGTYDNLNSGYYPNRGFYFNFRYTMKTDNFYRFEGQKPMHSIKFTLIKPYAINRKITITPQIAGRIILSDTVPFIYSNLAGGQWDSHYLNQQISLQGLQGMEIFDKSLVKTELVLRYNIYKQHSLQAAINCTMHAENPQQLLDRRPILGGTLGYSYNTILGPLIIRFSYSDRTRKIYPFISAGYYF